MRIAECESRIFHWNFQENELMVFALSDSLHSKVRFH